MEAGQGPSVAGDLRRILDVAELDIQINSLQLPMFYGEGAFIRLGFHEPLVLAAFQGALEAVPGITVVSGDELPSPLDATGDEDMLVQLFEPQSESSVCFDLWYAADNLSCGGAGNVVRLIEHLTKKLN